MEKIKISFNKNTEQGSIALLEISEDGIRFNHRDFPKMTASDFADEFVKILEANFKVSFHKNMVGEIFPFDP